MTISAVDNINIDIQFGDFSIEELTEQLNKITSRSTSNALLSTSRSNPQSPSTPVSSPPSTPKKNNLTPNKLNNTNLLFTYNDIMEWINYERIMMYNKTQEYSKQYRNQNIEKTLRLIKQQTESYELERHLRDIYISTHNIIYNT